MLRELKDVEQGEHAAYLRFSKMPRVKTKMFADGQINVDLDSSGEVIGIEILSLDPEDLRALAQIATEYKLSLNGLTNALRRKSA
jgi:uncharacterized protein YuzE